VGVFLKTDKVLQVGESIQVLIDWPVALDQRCPLGLLIVGKVLRSNGAGTAVEIMRYEFGIRHQTGAGRSLKIRKSVKKETKMKSWYMRKKLTCDRYHRRRHTDEQPRSMGVSRASLQCQPLGTRSCPLPRSTFPGRGAVQLRSDLRDFALDLLALGLVADQYCPRSRCFESASSSGRELWGRVACVPSACMR
jgi:hypothetical protein